MTTPISPGDRVYYLPAVVHAHERDASGRRPWVYGVVTRRNRPIGAGRFETVEEVRELSPAELEDHLAVIRRHPNPAEAARLLVPIRPDSVRPAVVTAVNPGGTVDLDICGTNGGVTLHYRGVPVDQSRQPGPHTCRPCGDGHAEHAAAFAGLLGRAVFTERRDA